MSENVKTIAANAFFRCTSLAAVNLPDELEQIGEGAFLGCINLKTVNASEAVLTLVQNSKAFAKPLEGESVISDLTSTPADRKFWRTLLQICGGREAKKFSTATIIVTHSTEAQHPKYGCPTLSKNDFLAKCFPEGLPE